MRLLLDSHIFLWFASKRGAISERVLSTIEDRTNEVYISSATVWEITQKYALGRLPLPMRPATYFLSRMQIFGFAELSITNQHALALDGLPLHHRDPFDRIMIAQAQVEDLTFVTADPAILAYPIKTLKAS